MKLQPVLVMAVIFLAGGAAQAAPAKKAGPLKLCVTTQGQILAKARCSATDTQLTASNLGAFGVQGIQGSQGIPGPQGESGPAGPTGPQGPSGAGHQILKELRQVDVSGAVTIFDTTFLGSGFTEMACPPGSILTGAKCLGTSLPSGVTVNASLALDDSNATVRCSLTNNNTTSRIATVEISAACLPGQ